MQKTGYAYALESWQNVAERLQAIEDKKEASKPQKSKAGKVTGEKKIAKQDKWRDEFLKFYNEYPKKRFDEEISDREIILKFIRGNKRRGAPKTERTYYDYLKS